MENQGSTESSNLFGEEFFHHLSVALQISFVQIGFCLYLLLSVPVVLISQMLAVIVSHYNTRMEILLYLFSFYLLTHFAYSNFFASLGNFVALQRRNIMSCLMFLTSFTHQVSFYRTKQHFKGVGGKELISVLFQIFDVC